MHGHCRPSRAVLGCSGLPWAVLGGAGLGQGLWLGVPRPMRSQATSYKGAIVPGASLVISQLGHLCP